ncbi:hypothetical protein [Phytopseudomonas dryadis]|uniref:Cellulose synthase n=1 Tax=Phytopseudomonas dryadis TaxID=2487520 RepID=A0A4Q9QPZ6_9GAMM|nr:hypothetical protein [Pseudomonas dryadis]TBU82635.1 hypothetical protein DNK44_25870 [Pseudomonas dryadis]
MHKTDWRLAFALATLLPLAAQACGPDFPYRLLDDRANALSELPEGNFNFEVSRLGTAIEQLGQAGAGTLSNYWYDDDAYTSARDQAEREQMPTAQAQRIATLRTLDDPAQVEAQGRDLPAELRLYTAGAVAFARGDDARASDYFRRVLALPAEQRALRSTWAAYSLGRSLARQAQDTDEDARLALLQRAAEAYRQARDLHIEGFSDPLELGIASLGEEARLALLRDDWAGAIHLYASQSRHGSATGTSSLRQVARALMALPPERLATLLDQPPVQRLLTAQLFSRLDSFDPLSEATQALIEQLQKLPVAALENADRLAALSYQRGDYGNARRFLEQAGDSGLAWWLRAKLALQRGDKPAALQAYAAAAKAFPREESWGLRMTEGGTYETVQPGCRIGGEMAILALERGDYLDAFEQLYRGGELYWMDAALVAERVLSVDELKGYVDAHIAAEDQPAEDWRQPVANRMRELLARRLVREGRSEQAIAYFNRDELRDQARQYQTALDQAESAWTDIGKAEGYYRAAIVAREGLDLMGYELDPDNVWFGGSFYFATRREAPLQPAGLLSAAEAERQNASAANPDRRFHYRYVAADLASRAADHLPPRSQAFAVSLCLATGWTLERAPDIARGYYRRYVEQGPYVPWARHFGYDCPEANFDGARALLWQQRQQAVRQALRPYKYLLAAIPVLLLAGVVLWRRRRSGN